MRKKALLIGVIVWVLAIGGIGAAFATGMNFTNVGALSLDWETVPQVNVDFVGYELDTGDNLPVEVDGVYISFDRNLHSPNNSTVIFVSLRDANFQELGYCVATVPASTTLDKDTIYKLPFAVGSQASADPRQIYYIKVTVGENSSYCTPPTHDQDYGKDAGIAIMPGASLP